MSIPFVFSKKALSQPIDNSALVLFRVVFGFLVFMEGITFFYLDHIDKIYLNAPVVFTYMGFEWMKPLPGIGMYLVFVAIGVSGLMIMLGWKYRWSSWLFALLWTYVYFSHKEHYNNHHYLFMLVAYAMAIMAAADDFSLDVYFNPSQRRTTCPQWCISFFIIQLLIVYTYAAIAKLYPDWLQARPLEIWMRAKAGYWLLGDFLQHRWAHYLLSYGGIIFDGTIIWLLLFRKTRWFGVGLSVVFHLFNSIIFRIGIFPYLMLGSLFFFFPGEELRKNILARLKWGSLQPCTKTTMTGVGYVLFVGYFFIQLALPLRHFFIEGNVHWTEEGHKLSWHMMLRSKSGSAVYRVTNLETGEVEKIRPSRYMGSKGKMASTQPDVIWQFARHLKKEYEQKGWQKVAVYVDCVASLNGRKSQRLIDPAVDIANVPWDFFKHSEWVLHLPEAPEPEEVF